MSQDHMGAERRDAEIIKKKLTEVLSSTDEKSAALFIKGGYKEPGYGVPAGSVISGSLAVGNEGSQGYYVDENKEVFLDTVRRMREFFDRRGIKFVVKPGIGGQHTPFQGIAEVFQTISRGNEFIYGEYELGKDYEKYIDRELKKRDLDWGNVAVIPSSKSGSTDETMMVFVELLCIFLKKMAEQIVPDIDCEKFALAVLEVLHGVNFEGGAERKSGDLFKGFSLAALSKELEAEGMRVSPENLRKIFAAVLGNMFFETTDRPEDSRLSAFIRNSGLDKELGADAPGFGAMFDNVGGRWTGDLHMMTFLAFYGLDAETYWNRRRVGIMSVRSGRHQANQIGDMILDEAVKNIALLVPDELFWFGKSVEQNFNESIWQEGFANIITVKKSLWRHQRRLYENKADTVVISLIDLKGHDDKLNVINIDLPSFGAIDLGQAAIMFADLFSLFYGITITVGDRLIARALIAKGLTADKVNISDLNDPATKILQENLYLRQPYVELGKQLLKKRLEKVQSDGKTEACREEILKAAAAKAVCCVIEGKAEKNMPEELADIEKIFAKGRKYAAANNRKFVPFIYLEGDKFYRLRDELIRLGVEWVMQGTGDQHISYQQVLAQPKRYFPAIISFVPDEFLPGRPAIGFAKGYLDNISPNVVRDYFAEASFKALTELRGEQGGMGIFARFIDSPINIRLVEKLLTA